MTSHRPGAGRKGKKKPRVSTWTARHNGLVIQWRLQATFSLSLSKRVISSLIRSF